ncbi:MAG TPA: DMT family transporter [Bosea sp. (in: a-proteobacteria)]|jgi:drug/metabolite transporter (DMT)-like permease|uniref:DMT family transporter n=1 Tax=Bosea sp. (in: a-proteobacteria) TaxID=1871050 RepID=UPI002E0E559B|nr:DMT family transporter [Bosea sp. (in: a-proteobacteria)]
MSEERQTGRQGRAADTDGVAEAEAPPRLSEPLAEVVLVAPPSRPPADGLEESDESAGPDHRRLRRWWTNASPNLRGSLYMFSALLVYAVMVGAIKHVGNAIPLVQILLIRQIIMSLIIIAFAGGSLRPMLRTRRPGLQVARGILTLIAMLCGFTAVIRIPLAEATAIGFSQVLFVTVAAVIVLKEQVDGRRWAATIIGFIGVLVMLRPTSEGLDTFALLAVAGAVFNAAITVSVRMLAATERTDTILIWQGIVLITTLALPAWLWWVPLDATQWFWLIVLSLFGTAGQWLITRAYQVGEAAALAPLEFSRLILASFTGFIFFAEIPALTTWIGAAIVIGATLYTIRKNARPFPREPSSA